MAKESIRSKMVNELIERGKSLREKGYEKATVGLHIREESWG
jgi:hypothetical protein